jgi:hypothetical protein
LILSAKQSINCCNLKKKAYDNRSATGTPLDQLILSAKQSINCCNRIRQSICYGDTSGSIDPLCQTIDQLLQPHENGAQQSIHQRHLWINQLLQPQE